MSSYMNHHTVRNDGSHTLQSLRHLSEYGVVVFNDIDTVCYDSHLELLNYILIADIDDKLIIGEVHTIPPFYETKLAFAKAVRPMIRQLHTELNNTPNS